jgi:ferrochelatase
LFSYHGVPERHIRKTDITNHIVKLMDLAVIHRRRHMSFATVISYETTKQVVKLLGIPEGKYSQTFQSRLAGDK